MLMRRVVSIGLVFAALGAPASGQDSRAEAIAQEKARKAAQLEPYRPTAAERVVTRIGEGLVTLPQGVFPAIGSIYAGGGLAAGPGARVFVGDRSYLEGRAMYSIRQYALLEASSVIPELFRGRLALRANAAWRDATQVGFFGLGMGTSLDDRANFRMKQRAASLHAGARPAGPLFAAAAIGYEDYSLERGRGAHTPVEDAFTPGAVPGIAAEPTYVHLSASAGADSRPAPGYARRGGRYGVTYHAWRDRAETFSFNLVEADVVQHLPLLRENVIISLHGRVQSTLGDTDVVPYFLLPALGSGSTLRGYSTGRFRDRHALLLQAEWRWVVSRAGLDMAVFYDAGKVSDRRTGLGLSGMKSNVGVGLRLHGPRTTPLRIELARGNEGFNLVFAASAAF